jgi:hypothetical protein
MVYGILKLLTSEMKVDVFSLHLKSRKATVPRLLDEPELALAQLLVDGDGVALDDVLGGDLNDSKSYIIHSWHTQHFKKYVKAFV